MLCPFCHQEIQAESKFCNFCGKAILSKLFCSSCGAKLPPNSRFCHICGTAVFSTSAPKIQQNNAVSAEQEQLLKEQLCALEQEEAELQQHLDTMQCEQEKLEQTRAELAQEKDQLAESTASLLQNKKLLLEQIQKEQDTADHTDAVIELQREASVSPTGKAKIALSLPKKAKVAVLALVVVIGLAAFLPYSIKAMRYQRAVKAVSAGEYGNAIELFIKLKDYKDCPQQLDHAFLKQGDQLLQAGQYQEAIDSYGKMVAAEESTEAIKNVNFIWGKDLLAKQKPAEGIVKLEAAAGYSNADELCQNAAETLGTDYYSKKDYKNAAKYLDKVENKPKELLEKYFYASGQVAWEEKDYASAAKNFGHIRSYLDSNTYWQEAAYAYAGKLFDQEDYAEALKYYQQLGSYQDAQSKVANCTFCTADDLAAHLQYKDAIEYYESLGNYSYDGVSAASQATMLKNMQQIRGTYDAKKSYVETRQVYTRTGSYDYWYNESLYSGQELEITCTYNSKSRTFDIKGNLAFYRYTDFSYVSDYLDPPTKATRSFHLSDVTSIPSTIEVDSNTRLTYSNGTFYLNYYQSEHHSVGMDYRYTTNITYAK